MPQNSRKTDFENAAEETPPSLVGELWAFMIENRNWWMIPILMALAMIGVLITLSATGAAPFIYTLF